MIINRVIPNSTTSNIETIINSIKAITVTTIAPKNPVWWRPLMINHAIIKTMIHANQPPRNRNVRA